MEGARTPMVPGHYHESALAHLDAEQQPAEQQPAACGAQHFQRSFQLVSADAGCRGANLPLCAGRLVVSPSTNLFNVRGGTRTAAETAAAAPAATIQPQPLAHKPQPEPEPEPEPQPPQEAAGALGGGYYMKPKNDDEVFRVPKKKKPQTQRPPPARKEEPTPDDTPEAPTAAAGTTVSLARSGGIKKKGEKRKGGKDVMTTNLRVADPNKLLQKGRRMCFCQGMHHVRPHPSSSLSRPMSQLSHTNRAAASGSSAAARHAA